MITALSEIAVAGTVTTVISTSVNADGLLTSLIGFATAFITVVGGEVIKYLVAYFKKKTKDIDDNDKDQK